MAELLRVGDQRTIQFSLTNTPVGGSTSAFDLTGYTVTLIKTNRDTNDEKSITNSDSQITITSAAGGLIQLSPNATFWKAPGTYDVIIKATLSSTSFFFPATGSLEFVVQS